MWVLEQSQTKQELKFDQVATHLRWQDSGGARYLPTGSDPDALTFTLLTWNLYLRQEEAHPHPHTEEVAPPAETSSRSMSLEVDSSSEASSGRRSFIGLSDMELLKFAFSHPQTEGATESPEVHGEHLDPL